MIERERERERDNRERERERERDKGGGERDRERGIQESEEFILIIYPILFSDGKDSYRHFKLFIVHQSASQHWN